MSGVQRSMLELFQHLDRDEYDIYVICKQAGDLTRECDRIGIHTILIPNLVREIHPIQDILAFIGLVRICRQYRFDIIHTHCSKTGVLGRVAARVSGVPQVFHTVHGLPFHEFSPPLLRRLYSLIERFSALFSDKVIFVNNEERIMAIREKLVPPVKAITVYNGVSFDQIRKFDRQRVRNSIRRQWGIPHSAFVIGYMGRLWEQKDPETLLGIIARCQDKPFRFLIVGDGPYKSRFEKAALTNGNIVLTGWVDNPYAYYPAFDILLLPSLWEGLSRTLIEALAFGKPLVASNIKGNRECVHHGVNGFLCAPKNIDDFGLAIDRLEQDAALFQQLSVNARKISHLYFDSDVNNKIVTDLYKQQ
jgi:glycosyltransferase involved in cell wall biosynthesis